MNDSISGGRETDRIDIYEVLILTLHIVAKCGELSNMHFFDNFDDRRAVVARFSMEEISRMAKETVLLDCDQGLDFEVRPGDPIKDLEPATTPPIVSEDSEKHH